MTKLLIKLFVKDYKNTDDVRVRERYGKFSGAVGIVSNLVLCAAKILIGIISASIAIIADGINNLSDASSSIITLVGFKLAALPEDKKHPYGHARIEYLTGIIISIIIIFVGGLLLKSSAGKILHPEQVEYTAVTIVVLVAAIGIKFWQSAFYGYVSRAIDSVTVKAASADSRNDVISTAAVLLGVIITKCSGLVLDGYIGCAVALFIIWSGIDLIKETSSPLLGEAPDEDLVNNIKKIAEGYDGVLGIHDLVVHNYGPGKVFASMHVEVDATKNIMESHDMIDNIEREIGEALHVHFVVHMDPVMKNDPELDEVKHIVCSCIDDMDGVLSMHDLREVKGPTHTNYIFDVVLSPDCRLPEDEIHDTIESTVQKVRRDSFVVITFDRSYTGL